MYFTPRGLDETTQKFLDCPTAHRLIDVALNDENVADFFDYFGWKKIVICGANHFCQSLIKLLSGSDIIIEYILDRNYYKFSNGMYMNIPIKNYSEIGEMMEPDIVVIASNYYFNDITDELLANNIPLEKIISINDVLFGMGRLKQ